MQKYCKLKHQPIQKDKINKAKLKLGIKTTFLFFFAFCKSNSRMPITEGKYCTLWAHKNIWIEIKKKCYCVFLWTQFNRQNFIGIILTWILLCFVRWMQVKSCAARFIWSKNKTLPFLDREKMLHRTLGEVIVRTIAICKPNSVNDKTDYKWPLAILLIFELITSHSRHDRSEHHFTDLCIQFTFESQNEKSSQDRAASIMT